MTEEEKVDLPFTAPEYARRLKAVRDAAVRQQLDVLLVQGPEDIFYLSGFHTLGFFAYHALVVPVDGELRLITRYGDRQHARARSWVRDIDTYRDTEDPIAATVRAVSGSKARRVGVDTGSDRYLPPSYLTPSAYRRLTEEMPGHLLSECSGVVEQIRAVKSDEELAYVEAAGRIASAAVVAGLDAVADGRSDVELAAAVYNALILAGGEYPPLPPLISVGAETTLSHNTWSGRVIRTGDMAMFEVPGVVKRYLAPVARSASVGNPPPYIPDRVKLALESVESGIDAMRPGITCAEVYRAFVRPYAGTMYDIPIRTAYSVGVNFPPRWVECPDLDILPNNDTVLEPGMVFHTPRDVRVYGEQRAIFSETVAITPTGHKVLTSGRRELFRK